MRLFTWPLGFIREDAIIFTTLHRSFNKKAALNARTEIGPVYKIRENIRHTHTHNAFNKDRSRP